MITVLAYIASVVEHLRVRSTGCDKNRYSYSGLQAISSDIPNVDAYHAAGSG